MMPSIKSGQKSRTETSSPTQEQDSEQSPKPSNPSIPHTQETIRPFLNEWIYSPVLKLTTRIVAYDDSGIYIGTGQFFPYEALLHEFIYRNSGEPVGYV